MQHDDLDKTEVLKIQRDFRSDIRKLNSKSVLSTYEVFVTLEGEAS
jgi:hypothetical protein